jgi:hypothetical protein
MDGLETSREFDPLSHRPPVPNGPSRDSLPSTPVVHDIVLNDKPPSVYGMGTQEGLSAFLFSASSVVSCSLASRPDTPNSQHSRRSGSVAEIGQQENIATIQPTVHQQINAGQPRQCETHLSHYSSGRFQPCTAAAPRSFRLSTQCRLRHRPTMTSSTSNSSICLRSISNTPRSRSRSPSHPVRLRPCPLSPSSRRTARRRCRPLRCRRRPCPWAMVVHPPLAILRPVLPPSVSTRRRRLDILSTVRCLV